MATTKQLLEAALLKIGSRASTPSPTVDTINVVLDDNGKTATYTPPADGYLYLEHRGVSPNVDYIDVSKNRRWYNSRVYDSANGCPISFTTYVTKGVELTIRYIGHTSCRLIKSVGGGYSLLAKTLKRGRSLCLRLKNFLMHTGKHLAVTCCLLRIPTLPLFPTIKIGATNTILQLTASSRGLSIRRLTFLFSEDTQQRIFDLIQRFLIGEDTVSLKKVGRVQSFSSSQIRRLGTIFGFNRYGTNPSLVALQGGL